MKHAEAKRMASALGIPKPHDVGEVRGRNRPKPGLYHLVDPLVPHDHNYSSSVEVVGGDGEMIGIPDDFCDESLRLVSEAHALMAKMMRRSFILVAFNVDATNQYHAQMNGLVRLIREVSRQDPQLRVERLSLGLKRLTAEEIG